MIELKPRYTLNTKHLNPTSLDSDLQKINPVCLDILAQHGFETSAQIRPFLFPPISQSLSPLTCKDIEPALDILEDAVRTKKEIVVYRDYDVDGICAGAIALECLGGLGARVHHYANDRSIDGFGICKNGINEIMRRWPETKVILTVDNGVTGHEAITYANQRGISVVVTDHHEPGDTLPPAKAVVDLKRKDESYPFRELCGAGIIFRVMLDLYRRMNCDVTAVLSTLDLAALATVADVVPLIGENRAFVQQGLKSIESAKRPFFRHMLRLFDVKVINAHYTLAFQIVPALNSLSRMGENTDFAVEALISKDDAWVELQCNAFIELNKARKEKTSLLLEEAQSQIGETPDPVIVSFSDNFAEGIVGIIAGRLKEEYWRPVLVFARDTEGNWKGSGRSVDGFDLKAALDQCADLLLTYGGHKKAVGLSLKPENLAEFQRRICALAANVQLAPKEVELSCLLDEDSLTLDLVHDLRVLEPYGEGFAEPVFGLRARPDSVKFMGAENQHVKLTCSKSGLSIIGWNQANAIRSSGKIPVKYVGKPALNVWNNNISLQFIQEN